MISCKKATELISKAMEDKLSLKEELSLKLHLFICEFCEQFKKQVGLFRAVLERDSDDKDGLSGLEHGDHESCISAEAKQRIKRKLREKESNSAE